MNLFELEKFPKGNIEGFCDSIQCCKGGRIRLFPLNCLKMLVAYARTFGKAFLGEFVFFSYAGQVPPKSMLNFPGFFHRRISSLRGNNSRP